MTDTPKHIQDLQLQIWLSKSLSERLHLALQFNEALFLAGKKAREKMQGVGQQKQDDIRSNNS